MYSVEYSRALFFAIIRYRISWPPLVFIGNDVNVTNNLWNECRKVNDTDGREERKKKWKKQAVIERHASEDDLAKNHISTAVLAYRFVLHWVLSMNDLSVPHAPFAPFGIIVVRALRATLHPVLFVRSCRLQYDFEY